MVSAHQRQVTVIEVAAGTRPIEALRQDVKLATSEYRQIAERANIHEEATTARLMAAQEILWEAKRKLCYAAEANTEQTPA